MRSRPHDRGFTLVEIVFTTVLVAILAGLSLWTLKPANSKAPALSLAMALAEELSAARQLAISSGRPVALGMPVDSTSATASSVYRLEGWNVPNITWSKGFSGDYPNCGFAAARWSGGGSWSSGPVASVVSKIGAFDLTGQWLPSELANDYIFCFTPDGGLVTNNLPALDGRYVVVVGQNLSVSGASVTAATAPVTIFVSPYGAVETVPGLPGGSVPQGSASGPTSAPVGRTNFDDLGEIRLSKIRVTPRMDGAPEDEGFCVPGQYVTLEVYAYDPEGRGLFAKWKQPTNKGLFTYPDGGAASGAVLESEVDRMEYVDAAPADVSWPDVPPPAGGLFRARWGWTVPQNSPPGTEYEIEVDVKDVKGQAHIVNLPPKYTMKLAPKGRIVAEKLINGIWQIVQFNPDGSGQSLLSPVGVPESMPSVDRSGKKMALLQGESPNRYVKVRSLEGGAEHNVTPTAGNFTSVAISPDGAWVSYRDQTNNQIITRKVDGSDSKAFAQTWSSGSGTTIKKSRSGFSQDSKYLIYEHQNSLRFCRLGDWGSDALYLSNEHLTTDWGIVLESLFAPTSYRTPDGQERIMFSLGNHNSVLISVPWDPGSPPGHVSCFESPMLLPDLDGGGGGAGSSGIEDDYPSISLDGRALMLNRSPYSDGATEDVTDQELWIADYDSGTGNYIGPPRKVSLGDVRRAVWVP